ncbi:AXDND1 [Bugula neritina]|uniref:AXDND1 n=1 Tax=Bugula neritina TaxID=10212 RepID=A0A7J7J6J9_BUGNE|nr:AXDND1 [Bugula neritina]
MIQINTGFETWENKLIGIIHSGQTLPHSDTESDLLDDDEREWMSFMEQMDEWVLAVDNCIESIGSVNTEDDKEKGNIAQKIDVHEMMRKAHMWSVTTNNSIDSEDSKYIEQVTQLHTQMVKWMVHILLRLAPDMPGTSVESIEQSLVNSPSINDLVEEATVLFQQLDSFSLLIHGSCENIVRLRTQDRVASGDDMAEKELNDLQGMKYEAYHWIYASCILIMELANENIDYKPLDKKFDMTQFSKARTAKSHVLDYMESLENNADAQSSVAGDDEPPAASSDVKRENSVPEKDPSSENEPVEATNVLKVEEAGAVTEAGTEAGTEADSVEPDAEKAMEPVPPSQPKPRSEGSRPASAVKQAGHTPGPSSRQPSASGSTEKSAEMSRPPSIKKDDSLSKIEVIGRDDNTRPAVLPEPTPDEPPPRPSSGMPMAVDSQKAYDALKTVQKLQVQLLETEQRAQTAEESEAKNLLNWLKL